MERTKDYCTLEPTKTRKHTSKADLMEWKKLNEKNWLEGYYKLKIRLLKNALKEYSTALKKLQAKKK